MVKEVDESYLARYITHYKDASNILLNSLILTVCVILFLTTEFTPLLYFGVGTNFVYYLILFSDKKKAKARTTV